MNTLKNIKDINFGINNNPDIVFKNKKIELKYLSSYKQMILKTRLITFILFFLIHLYLISGLLKENIKMDENLLHKFSKIFSLIACTIDTLSNFFLFLGCKFTKGEIFKFRLIYFRCTILFLSIYLCLYQQFLRNNLYFQVIKYLYFVIFLKNLVYFLVNEQSICIMLIFTSKNLLFIIIINLSFRNFEWFNLLFDLFMEIISTVFCNYIKRKIEVLQRINFLHGYSSRCQVKYFEEILKKMDYFHVSFKGNKIIYSNTNQENLLMLEEDIKKIKFNFLNKNIDKINREETSIKIKENIIKRERNSIKTKREKFDKKFDKEKINNLETQSNKKNENSSKKLQNKIKNKSKFFSIKKSIKNKNKKSDSYDDSKIVKVILDQEEKSQLSLDEFVRYFQNSNLNMNKNKDDIMLSFNNTKIENAKNDNSVVFSDKENSRETFEKNNNSVSLLNEAKNNEKENILTKINSFQHLDIFKQENKEIDFNKSGKSNQKDKFVEIRDYKEKNKNFSKYKSKNKETIKYDKLRRDSHLSNYKTNKEIELDSDLDYSSFSLLGEYKIDYNYFSSDSHENDKNKSNIFKIYERNFFEITDYLIFEVRDDKIKDNIDKELINKKNLFNFMIHEFKTPLNAIISLLKKIKIKENFNIQKTLNGKNTRNINALFDYNIIKDINTITSLSNYTLFLISNLIQFSAKDDKNDLKISTKEVKLKRILDFNFDILKALIECNENKSNFIETIIKIDEEIINFSIDTDEFRLNQILFNLISNAVKFTKLGNITIDAHLQIDDSFDKKLIIDIKDSGIGMGKSQQDYILNNKFNLYTNYEINNMGTGLGLYISNKIAEKLNYKINFSSEENKGTKFSIEIPYSNIFFKKINDNKNESFTENKTVSNESQKRKMSSQRSLYQLKDDSIILQTPKEFLESGLTRTNHNEFNSPKRETYTCTTKSLPQKDKVPTLFNFNTNINNFNYGEIRNYVRKINLNTNHKNKTVLEEQMLNEVSPTFITSGKSFPNKKSKFESINTFFYNDDSSSENDVFTYKPRLNFPDGTSLVETNKFDTLENFTKTMRISKEKIDLILGKNQTKYKELKNDVRKNNDIYFKNYYNCNFVTNMNNYNKQGNLNLSITKEISMSIFVNKNVTNNEILNITFNKIKIIVIIDDNKYVRESIKKSLERILKGKNIFEFEILEGNDGIDLLKYIIDPRYIQKIKLIIIDENMEYMQGSHAIKIIRQMEVQNKIPKYIIFSATSFNDKINENNLLSVGADYILSKPISKDILMKEIINNDILSLN